METKPKASGNLRKRKHHGETEPDPEVLAQVPKRKNLDGKEVDFQDLGKAQKKTPREQQHLEHQKDQPDGGLPSQLKHLPNPKGPPGQAGPEKKPVDGSNVRKRTYSTDSILEENEISPQKKKQARSLPQMQYQDHVRSDSHRPDLPRPPPQITQESGTGDSLLPNKVPVLATEKKPFRKQEMGRGVDQSLDITQEMDKEIQSALGPGPLDEILSRRFKLQVTRADLQTLEDGRWLNDEVINFYLNLVVERNQRQGYPALHLFSTFFYQKLKQGGYSSVKRWTRGVNIFEKEVILLPIHQKVHWSLVVIDMRKQNIVYLDSMGQTGRAICDTIFEYLKQESKSRRNIELDPLQWKRYSMTPQEIPQQLNGSDCGVFACKYADYIARDQPVTFTQQDMPLFRKRMVWEILHSHLL